MLVAVWIITFCLIIGIGVYAGTKITSSNQWSGGDKTLSALSLGCVFAAWQVGGMGHCRSGSKWLQSWNCRLMVFYRRIILLYIFSIICKNDSRKHARAIGS